MDKNDILKALKNKVYYAELPSKMDVCLNNNTLHIIIYTSYHHWCRWSPAEHAERRIGF